MNLAQLFCCHQYQKVGFREVQQAGIRYSVRKYRCSKCGKEVLQVQALEAALVVMAMTLQFWIDGRFDRMKN